MLQRRIAVIAPPWYPIPPQGYGGIELVVGLLVKELRSRGHDVTLFGSAGSGLAVRPLAPEGWDRALGGPDERWREVTYAARLATALRRERPFDVIHDHTGGAGLVVAASAGRGPVVHTVHGPLGEPARTFYAALRGVGLIAISDHQRTTGPGLPWLATVPNAVDLGALLEPGAVAREPYLLCLARISPEKGQHVAIAVARRTGRPLVLAGKIEQTAASLAYYGTEIAPHLDGVRVRHLTNVAGREKAELLAGATALLAPVQWPEPFGLAVAEAMASGTPAVALRQGALPELVEDGVSGFVCDTVDEMVAAVGAAAELDAAACARAARLRFSPRALVERCLSVYAAQAAGAPEAAALVRAPVQPAGSAWALATGAPPAPN